MNDEFLEMYDNVDSEDIEQIIEDNHGKAEKLLNDEDKMERFLQKLEKKFKAVPIAGSSLAYIPIMISMVRAYIKKEYTEPPIASVVSIVATLIYFVNPFDLIPDGLLNVGLLDDALVVTACLTLVRTDIEDYRIWRKESGMEIEDIPGYADIAEESEQQNKYINAFLKGRKSKK